MAIRWRDRVGLFAFPAVLQTSPMKVFSKASGETLLIGRCDIPEGTVDVYDVPLFGASHMRMERFGIGGVNIFRPDGTFVTETGVLLVPGQDPELLPGWQPLVS
jgi:hypothetical protein